MPTDNYILTSSGNFMSIQELRHGRDIRYIDLDEDEMMHYKYLYKKKVNGKWRYYYDVGDAGYIDGNTGKKPPNVKGYSWLEDKLGYDERDRANRADSVYRRADKNSTNREYSSREEARAEFNRVAELGKNAVAAHKDYMKTPLGQLEKAENAIKTAKKSVANWLRKLASKLG